MQISSPLPLRHAPWGPHRILAYGIPADLTDEYLRIGETTAIESLRAFVKEIVEVFGDWYLRAPNEADICRYYQLESSVGFQGC